MLGCAEMRMLVVVVWCKRLLEGLSGEREEALNEQQFKCVAGAIKVPRETKGERRKRWRVTPRSALELPTSSHALFF